MIFVRVQQAYPKPTSVAVSRIEFKAHMAKSYCLIQYRHLLDASIYGFCFASREQTKQGSSLA